MYFIREICLKGWKTLHNVICHKCWSLNIMDEAACSSTRHERMEPRLQTQRPQQLEQEEDKQSNAKESLTKREKVKLKRNKRKEKKKERRRQLKAMGNEDHITLNRTKRRKLKSREQKVKKRFEKRRKKDEEERNAARYTYKFYSSSSDD